ncbi:hypothetical protein L2E82_51644 [Cichorium intybus]|nr:hypothetical protein L2E82_51644 [Cichorium intybus]
MPIGIASRNLELQVAIEDRHKPEIRIAPPEIAIAGTRPSEFSDAVAGGGSSAPAPAPAWLEAESPASVWHLDMAFDISFIFVGGGTLLIGEKFFCVAFQLL